MTPERSGLDAAARGLAQQTLALTENAANLAALVAGYTNEQLEAPPYEYTPDEWYVLRAFTEKAAQWAAIVGAGGSLSAADGALLLDVTRKMAGPWLIGASGQRVV
jgi:hypothetical protein